MSLAFACTLLLPLQAHSQTSPCTIERGTVNFQSNPDNPFSQSNTGSDFKITCNGDLEGVANRDWWVDLFAFTSGFVAGKSKVIIDMDGTDNNEVFRIDTATEVGTLFITGSLANNDTEVDRIVISISDVDPDGGTAYDLDVENHGIIESSGNGRMGLVVGSYFGANVMATNKGTITTTGNTHQRGEGENFPNRVANGFYAWIGDGAGTITLVNEGMIDAQGTAARGMTADIGEYDDDPLTPKGGGDINIINRKQISTSGDGHDFGGETGVYNAHGISAHMNDSPGNISLRNESAGKITTSGTGARGMTGYTEGTGNVQVENFGTVTTTGGMFEHRTENFHRADGIYAGAQSGDATAINQSDAEITTGVEGDSTVAGAHGVRAVTNEVGAGTAMVSNAGRIITHGGNSHGMSTWAVSQIARGTNEGKITTHGDESDGASIIAPAGSESGRMVKVSNSGTIITNGDSSEGIEATFWHDEAENIDDAKGEAHAENSGTITVNGNGNADWLTGGVFAGFFHNPRNSGRILNGGDARVTNSGTVKATGNRTEGLGVESHGSGNVVVINTGTVTAGNEGDPDATPPVARKFGIGIRANAYTSSSSDDVDADVDVDVQVKGATANITAFGAESDDTSTNDFNETIGIGILAALSSQGVSSTTGHAKVTVSGGAKVSAFGSSQDEKGHAVMFIGGKGTLDLIASTLVGNVQFADGSFDDVLNVTESGSIDGKIDFGLGGDDEMNINIAENRLFNLTGDIFGLETMTITGPGTTHFSGGVFFENSALNLENGVLVVSGSLNLNQGTMTVHRAGKLVFDIDDEGKFTGQLFAGTLHFEGIDSADAAVYAQLNSDIEPDMVEGVQTKIATEDQIFPILFVDSITSGDMSDTPQVVTELQILSESGGEVHMVGTVESGAVATFDSEMAGNIGVAVLPENPEPGAGGSGPAAGGSGSASGGGGGGSGSGAGAAIGLGLLAVLLSNFLGGDDTGTSFTSHAFASPVSSYFASADSRSIQQSGAATDAPYRLWVRNSTGEFSETSDASVGGSEIGLSLQGNNGYYIEASMMPNVSGSVDSLKFAAEGSSYAINGGLRNDRHFANLRVSQGNFEAKSVVDNPVINSALISNSRIRSSQIQLSAGTSWISNGLRFGPSAAFQAGTFEQDAHDAHGAVMTASVPAYSQDYTSAKLGFGIAATQWLNSASSIQWRPHMRFDVMRTNSQDVNDLTLRQSDKDGILSFNTKAGVRSMPETVSQLSFGAAIKSPGSSQGMWKLAMTGLEADGEDYHAAMIGYQLKF